jgi:hypothetical protein
VARQVGTQPEHQGGIDVPDAETGSQGIGGLHGKGVRIGHAATVSRRSWPPGGPAVLAEESAVSVHGAIDEGRFGVEMIERGRSGHAGSGSRPARGQGLKQGEGL